MSHPSVFVENDERSQSVSKTYLSVAYVWDEVPDETGDPMHAILDDLFGPICGEQVGSGYGIPLADVEYEVPPGADLGQLKKMLLDLGDKIEGALIDRWYENGDYERCFTIEGGREVARTRTIIDGEVRYVA